MTELDKFKRRLIRSVARLLLHERRPEEEVWEQLQKETGCDCKLLWERMRALTVKKMKRLLAADDRPEQVAAVARMSPTDWLLFDLVLVHEKCDVITRDSPSGHKEDEKQLVELFHMVRKYKIDKLVGDKLAEAWTNLTLAYNSTGRKCSAMLLQRRWYQLQEATRERFYKLWHNYRGNKGLWDKARDFLPTPLQADIAKRYPSVITRPFLDWDELIQKRKVILRQEFEQRMRAQEKKSSDDGKPDLVVIEPVIETIDLGMDSDEEGNQIRKQDGITPKVEPEATNTCEKRQDSTNFNLSRVKQEPPEEVDGLSNVQILEATHLPDECINDDSTNSEVHELTKHNEPSCSSDTVQKKKLNLEQQMSNFIHNTIEFDQISTQTDKEERIDTPDDLIQLKADEYFKSKLKKVIESQATQDENKSVEIEKVTDQDDVVDDIIKQKADEFVKKVDIKKVDTNKVDINKLVQDVVQDFELPSELSFVDNGIEFVDDGIEYVEEDENEDDSNNVPTDVKIKAEKPVPVSEIPTVDIKPEISALPASVEGETKMSSNEEQEKGKAEENGDKAAKFDLKLLMQPVVYTTKLDDMIIFKGKQFDSIQQVELIDSVIAESKPVSEKALKQIKIEPLNQIGARETAENNKMENAEEVDIVKNYGSTNVDMENQGDNDDNIENQTGYHDIDDGNHEDYDVEGDDNADGYESSTSIEINENLKVKPTSYLLQKPRSRSYNPIQLCKNPDFNTRLKRLTAGFFSSSRNRQLLSACKPMTIDLHKAFEPKLVNGTLYLKPSGETAPQQVEDDTCALSTTVVPSAMPIQSLLHNNTKDLNIDELETQPVHVDTVDLTRKPTDEEIARNKVINLRDLSEIRRINQTLLTAEVTPIRVENRDNRPYTHVDQSQPNPPITITEEDSHSKSPENNEIKIIGLAGGQKLPLPVHEPTSTRTDLQPKNTSTCNIPLYRRRGPKPRWDREIKARPTVYATIPGRIMPVPWISKLNASAQNIEDGLITIDTLNRMINKLHGMDNDYHDKKHKKVFWHIDRKSQNVEDPEIEENRDESEKSEEKSGTSKTNIPVFGSFEEVAEAQKSVSDKQQPETPEIDLTEKTKPKVDKAKVEEKKPKKMRGPVVVRKYCCWSKEKITKIGTKARISRKHLCGIICQCCCRFELLNVINKNRIVVHPRQTKRGVVNVYRTIELSDDETPESNVEHSVGKTAVPTPTPKVRVMSSSGPPPPIISCPPQEQQTIGVPEATVISLSGLIKAVNESTTNTTAPGLQETNTEETPAIKININFTQSNETTEPYIKVPAARTTAARILNPQASNTRSLDSDRLLQQIAALSPNVVPETNLKKVIVPIPRQTTKQKSIVIDASNNGTEKKGNVVILNSRNMVNKSKESPIFLGKDKILLTTVKFPPNMVDNPPTSKPLQPILTPTLPVPAGVQLILLPNGSLTYHIDPDVELSQEQLAGLPSIIATVQEQLNTSYPHITKLIKPTAVNDRDVGVMNDEPIVINDEPILVDVEDSISKTPSEKTKSKQTKPGVDFECSEIPSIPDTATDGMQAKSSAEGFTEHKANASQERSDEKASNVVLNNSDIRNESNNSDTITIGESTPIANAAENKDNQIEKLTEGSSSGRNLLSDLMEMSGISAEDTTPVPESVQQEPQVASFPNILPVNKDTASAPIMNSMSTPTLSELTPVTSLWQLKYACAHEGSFFKLDFSTGIVVPINVCIKKKLKKVPPLLSTYTIDLTDDVAPEKMPISRLSPSKPTPVALQKSNVKLLDIIKSRQTSTPNLLIRKRKILDINRVSMVESKSIQLLHGTRKQSMGKIEAKIDLVDSDTPMEEEYLVEQTDSDDSQIRDKRINMNVPNTDNRSDSGDSSDDEPLARKFIRIRENKNNHDVASKNRGDNEPTGSDATPSTSANMSYNINTMDTAAESEVPHDGSNMDVDEPFMDFTEEFTSDDQEDCILGV